MDAKICKLINRIPCSRLLIKSWPCPCSALRAHVEFLDRASKFNNVLESLPGKRYSSRIALRLSTIAGPDPDFLEEVGVRFADLISFF